jgi:pyridoxal phosphate enzyme (YggS family)
MLQEFSDIIERVAASAARSNRKPSDVTITAVTKGVSPEKINSYGKLAEELNIQPVIGESYLSEFMGKNEFIDKSFQRRYIGRLSAQQVPKIWRLFDVIETVGDLKTVEACIAQVKKGLPMPRLLFQVNVSNDERKSGFPPELTLDAVEFAYKNSLPISGLMTITERYDEGDDAVRSDFRALAQLSRNIREVLVFRGLPLETSFTDISMGMSGDFEIAVEEGASHIRLGSAIFGARAI